MNQKLIEEAISKRILKYPSKFEELFSRLCDKTLKKASDTRFGPYYQLYTYCFFIGLYNKQRSSLESLKKSDFSHPLGNWFSNNNELQNIMLMVAINEEIEDLFVFENLDDNDQKTDIQKIVTCIEEYTNGGLEILQSMLDNDELEEEDPFKFYDILCEIN